MSSLFRYGQKRLFVEEQGVAHEITDPQTFEQQTGVKISSLPQREFWGTSGANVDFNTAKEKAWLQPILGDKFASSSIEFLDGNNTAGLSGYYAKGTLSNYTKQQQGSTFSSSLNNSPNNSTSAATFSGLPDEIKNSAEWQLLTPNQQALAYFTYKAQTATNEAQKKDAMDALTRAKELADPYFREQIRMAQDEITRGSTSTTSDANSKIKQYNDRIDQLKQDLTFNREQLTLQQQQDLNDQLRKNQSDLFNLQQSAAESGLAFSSPRIQAENNLMTDQRGIAESTARKYTQAFREQENSANRGTLSATQGLQDTNRQLAENLTSISRKGESQVGSANLPAVSGVDPLGGVTGNISETNQKNVVDLQNILLKRQNPLNLA